MLEDHPDGTFTYLCWVGRMSVHDSILSNGGVSGKPGAIQGTNEYQQSPCIWATNRATNPGRNPSVSASVKSGALHERKRARW